ncbi:hypothetical protein D3C72_1237770 [compost metagenome]
MVTVPPLAPAIGTQDKTDPSQLRKVPAAQVGSPALVRKSAATLFPNFCADRA